MSADPAETPTLVTVSDGLYVRQAVDNMGWVDLGDYALIVDALEQPDEEESVMEALRQTLGSRPVRYVINTHAHYDHVALNNALKRRFGAKIVNQVTDPTGPDGRWFEGPRRRVLLLPMPGTHTSEDCILWVEPDKVLFAGDIFGWGLINYSGRLTSEAVARIEEVYGRLIEFGAETVVPGHGPVCGTAELKRWLEYFRWLRKAVCAACSAGKSDAEIRRQLAPPADMTDWWRFVLWKHEDAVGKVLRACRDGSLTGTPNG